MKVKLTKVTIILLLNICLNNLHALTKVVIPSSPPPENYKPESFIKQRSDVILPDIPVYLWSYGCVPTSGAMLAGYYDRNGYDNMYTGPANNGFAPLSQNSWGYKECPISASHMGIDGRTTKGHVDDYFIAEGNIDSDPYISGSWTEHTPPDCIADFVGCSMNKWNNADGYSVLFYNDKDNSKLEDYTGHETLGYLDIAHGLKNFFNDKGYKVLENYNQPIFGFNGINNGFSFEDYLNEIDNGRPVFIHVAGHTMLGIGYNQKNEEIIFNSTWSSSLERMKWGGIFDGSRQHFAVSVFVLDNSGIISDYNPVLTIIPTPGLPNHLNLNLDIENFNDQSVILTIEDSEVNLLNQHSNSFKALYNIGDKMYDEKLDIVLKIGFKSYLYTYKKGSLIFEEGK